MKTRTDQELLRDYAEAHSESAFAELVTRHLNLVYSAALRMVCDSHSAEPLRPAPDLAPRRESPSHGSAEI